MVIASLSRLQNGQNLAATSSAARTRGSVTSLDEAAGIRRLRIGDHSLLTPPNRNGQALLLRPIRGKHSRAATNNGRPLQS